MKFGKILKKSTYEPWKSNYIDYPKLKHLLREEGVEDDDQWTEDDESTFVEELINVELEKVNSFHIEVFSSLRDRSYKCQERIEQVVSKEEAQDSAVNGDFNGRREAELKDVLDELNRISEEINQLEKYSRINFTGFLKAAKKHDRKRGTHYRVRPLLQVRLAALPFNSEDYSPLLYRLSAMYTFIRQAPSDNSDRKQSLSNGRAEGNAYVSHKFWVHPENLLEVKTYVLRHLPVLVYNPKSSKVIEGYQDDPSITSLYFDNPSLSLYTHKVERETPASSVRLRWSGLLNAKPEIVLEKKTINEDGTSEEIQFPIKEKYINSFINGEYHMERTIQKLKAREGEDSPKVHNLAENVKEIQSFLRENALQPILRAIYTRMAFQVPGDDTVRVSIDTNLAMIREDALDRDRPCRDPTDWHRHDIDSTGMEHPFSDIRSGEITRFPFALLEIKIKATAHKRTSEWVSDLMSSHLVKEAPRFSKFAHGVAELFEYYANSFPFWLSSVGTDIRKHPKDAFQEEQDRLAQRAEDEIAVGSFMAGSSGAMFQPARSSPAGKGADLGASVGSDSRQKQYARSKDGQRHSNVFLEREVGDRDAKDAVKATEETASGLRSLFPSFSTSKYAHRHSIVATTLPPGVRQPGQMLKDMGPVRVEPKVWLANQRTFIKWCHVSILLASLSLALFNAAGPSNTVARVLAVTYTLVALFAGVWGWSVFQVRSRMIQQRSGKDFDYMFGPVVVCLGLVLSLCLNFGFKVSLMSKFLMILDSAKAFLIQYSDSKSQEISSSGWDFKSGRLIMGFECRVDSWH